MDINRATIVGRLTRDPEMRTTPTGVTVTSFAVATNAVWTDQSGVRKEAVEYHNVVAWRKLAEIAGKYLTKGRRVLIEGKLQTRNWEGQDGSKRNRTEIVADNLIMLDSKGQGTAPPGDVDSGEMNQAAPPEKSETFPPKPEVVKESSSDEISVEDIPF